MSDDANKACGCRHFEELWNNGHLDRVGDFFDKDFISFGRVESAILVRTFQRLWLSSNLICKA